MTILEALHAIRDSRCSVLCNNPGPFEEAICVTVEDLIAALEELAELKASQVSDEPVDLTPHLRRQQAYWEASGQGLSEQGCLDAMRKEQ